MSVSTYNPSVRVGNWNEDIQLEEDLLKDFLARRERGELMIQRSHNLGAVLLQPKELSTSVDGFVHFGDTVMLHCREAEDRHFYSPGMEPRDNSVLAVSLSDPEALANDVIEKTCHVAGYKKTSPVIRSSFVIKSVDGIKDGECLRYGQAFHIATLDRVGKLYLNSDQVSFRRCAKKSKHQEVIFTVDVTYATHWHVKHRDPRIRMEFEHVPVPANEEVIITNCKTNQNLALEQKYLLRTIMGAEYEISCHNYLDSHKAEEDINRWTMKMNVPGNPEYEIPRDARIPPPDKEAPPPEAHFPN